MRHLPTAIGFVVLVSTATTQLGWQQKLPATPYIANHRANMAYDSIRGRVVIHGGGITSDTWEWDGDDWSIVFSGPGGPGQAIDGHMAFDSNRGVCVLFGGYGSNQTWEWDGVSWQRRIPVTSPPGRSTHAMAFDSRRGRTVLFGADVPGDDETWEWDGTNWHLMTPPVKPPVRGAGAMAYDADRGVVVMFAGQTSSRATQADTWEWDGVSWTEKFPATSPAARRAHHMAYNSVSKRVILYGGNSFQGSFTDTWEWDGTDWTEIITEQSPPMRYNSVMAFDDQNSEMILASGESPAGRHADTWCLQIIGSTTAFGAGCGGSGASPELQVVGAPPTIGKTYFVSMTDVPPQRLATLYLGSSSTVWGSVSLPIALPSTASCHVLVSLDFGIVTPTSFGTAVWAIPVPSAPSLIGEVFYQQGFVLTPDLHPSVSASPGYTVLVGTN